MKLGIVTTGSRGDVQPFIALALALKGRGHEVTVVAPENFSALINDFGLAFKPVYGDVEEIIRSPAALKLLKGGNVFKFFYHLQKITAQTADRSDQDILDACAGLDALVTGVLPLPIVYSIAEKYHQKCAAVFLSMPPVATREFSVMSDQLPMGWIFNRLSFRLLGLGYAMIRRRIDRFRVKLGLPVKNVMKAMLASDIPAITAMSPQLLPRPADWPSRAQVTGFLYLPPEARKSALAAEMPEGLEEFLAAGDAPVYIGFGSIPVPDPERLYATLNGLLGHRRVVFCSGWSVLDNLPRHPDLFVAQYINHDWLLPRCFAAVIHGGIGTVGAVLRSGIPVIIVSVLADQPINGKMIERRKLGFHIPFSTLSAPRLLHALDAAASPVRREHCQRVAAAIRKEDGVGKAADWIEAYFTT